MNEGATQSAAKRPLTKYKGQISAILIVIILAVVLTLILRSALFSSSNPAPLPKTLTPTASSATTENSNSRFAYDFKDGTTQGWDTSEYKKGRILLKLEKYEEAAALFEALLKKEDWYDDYLEEALWDGLEIAQSHLPSTDGLA